MRQFGRVGIYWPVTEMVMRDLVEIAPDGSARPVQTDTGSPSKSTLLGLNPDRFRGDLRALAATGQFRVIAAPYHWQTRLAYSFLPRDLPVLHHFNPPVGSAASARHEDLLRFLRGFLRELYGRVGIDAVLGAALHYKQDHHWGRASSQIGVPYIVLHRECFDASPGARRENRDRWMKMGRFAGDHVIVHNNTAKAGLVETGFASAEQVSALGCLRMDRFVAQVGKRPKHTAARPRVVFFSFPHGSGILDLQWSDGHRTGFEALFNQSHVAFAELAQRRPDVDFVLSLKWGGNWHAKLRDAFAPAGIEPATIANLEIVDEPDVQRLLFETDVICGFNSTTLLEAGIAAKPIVIPVFGEAERAPYDEFVKLRDVFDLFDIARSPAEFQERIVARLADRDIDDACMAGRRTAFETWVSSLRGDAGEKYAQTIADCVARAKGFVREAA